ncbi:MAG: fatty acid cis/trans isomerase [Bdellovibrionota bacterium]|nr:fatty acid cis/trans isomerase [Bdellovibrionota bacterium]
MRSLLKIMSLMLLLGLSLPISASTSKLKNIDYFQDIKPIFDTRCVQCHACVQSPCGLNFSSEAGIRRGMISNYDTGNAGRIKSYHPSRLGIDAKNTSEWHDDTWKKTGERKKPIIGYAGRHRKNGSIVKDESFFPVIPLPSNVSDFSAPSSVNDNFITQLIFERRNNSSPVLDHEYFGELQSETSRVCPKKPDQLREHIEARAAMGSSAGMPYGLPALTDEQIAKLSQWIQDGSPMPEENILPPKVANNYKKDAQIILKIENFFNKTYSNNTAETKKRKLVSRYIYEHLFQSSLYLRDSNGERPQFYSLLRKDDACEKASSNVIPSLRPWEAYSPKEGQTEKIFYCLEPIDRTITHKNHITYKVDEARLKRWEQLFFQYKKWSVNYQATDEQEKRFEKIDAIDKIRGDSPREVIPQKLASMNSLAPRDDAHAANPFIAFREIPVELRYQFLLDDSKHFVRSFIRGPVCKGSTATNSIDEQFYVLFLKPEKDPMVIDPIIDGKKFSRLSEDLLDLPATLGSEGTLLKPKATVDFVRNIRVSRNKYRSLRQKAYEMTNQNGYRVEDLWDGQGANDINVPNINSNLTVFRNFNSAAVEQGLIGPSSKTLFVLDYSIFERLYYLLVSGYDPYADLTHQITSRLYMSYIRMEAEELFLNFLPSKIRKPMRDYWNTPGTGITEDSLKDKVDLFYPLVGENKESGEKYFSESNFQAVENEKTILEKGRKAIPKITDFAHEYRSNGDKAENMKIYEAYKDMYYVLAKYRQEFTDKTIQHLGKSRGYIDPFASFENRYSDTAQPIQTEEVNSFDGLEKLFAQVNGRPARYQSWVYLMPSVSHIVVDDKSSGKSELYTLVRQKEHFNVNWMGGEEGRRIVEDDSVIVYKGILGSYPNMIFRFDLAQSKNFFDELISLSKPRDGVESIEYSNFISKFGLPRNGPGSERFWAGYDHLTKIFQEKYPVEAGMLDLNRYGLDYQHTETVSFTDKDSGFLDEFLESFMKQLAELYIESFVEDKK